MNRSALPNLITFLRLLLAVPLVLLLLNRQYSAALVVLVVAGLSDGIDGFLARRYNSLSRLGAILDPLSDKVLLVSAYVTLGWLGDLPLWLVGLVMLRDVVIVAGAVAYQLLFNYVEIEPTSVSKINTLFQILLLLLVLVVKGAYPMAAIWVDTLVYTVAFTTLYSGSHYVWVWSRRAVAQRRENSRE